MFLPYAGALGAFQPGSIDFEASSSQSIETTANVAAIGTGDFTLEARIKVESLASERAIGGIGGSAAGGVMMSLVGTGPAEFRAYLGGSVVSFGGSYSAGTVYEFALCRSGSTVRLFVDGALSSFTTSASSISAAQGLVAQKAATGSGEFDGLIGFFHATARAKYTAAYTPAPVIEPDDDTLFLIHNPKGNAIEEANGLALTLNNAPTASSEFLI